MINQHFIVDSGTPIIGAKADDLASRLKEFIGEGFTVSNVGSPLQGKDTYAINGNGVTASVSVFPEGWNVYTPFESARRMVAVSFLEGDYESAYGLLIESLGIFQHVRMEIEYTLGTKARIAPLISQYYGLAAILIDDQKHTPFKVENPEALPSQSPPFGIFAANSRDLKLFRNGLKNMRNLSLRTN